MGDILPLADLWQRLKANRSKQIIDALPFNLSFPDKFEYFLGLQTFTAFSQTSLARSR